MKESTQRGQKLVITIIATVLMVGLIVAVLTAIRGTGNPLTSAIRLALIGMLCYFLYEGYAWARWILGILEGLLGLFSVLAALFFISKVPNSALLMMLPGVIHLACSGVLLFSLDVKAFQASRRREA